MRESTTTKPANPKLFKNSLGRYLHHPGLKDEFLYQLSNSIYIYMLDIYLHSTLNVETYIHGFGPICFSAPELKDGRARCFLS